MRVRLYYWFKGAPEQRPGGPWWYRDFKAHGEMDAYLKDIEQFLQHAYVIEADVLPEHDPLEIVPPVEAEKVEL